MKKYQSLEEDAFFNDLDQIIEDEVGEVFYQVLLNCGVFKDTEKGRGAFKTCCEDLYGDFL